MLDTVMVNGMPTLYSRVCFNISSSSRVKLSNTDTARMSWNAWWSRTQRLTQTSRWSCSVLFNRGLKKKRSSDHASYLSLSRRHELEDNVFEILKVDLSWIVKVRSVGHFGVGGVQVLGGCWWRIRTNTLVSFGPHFWWPLPCFTVWLRLHPLQRVHS